MSAAVDLGVHEAEPVAEQNLAFVLDTQRADGSWPYSIDAERDFIDHFHTCFVLKALAKIQRLRGTEACAAAIRRGLSYYVRNLCDSSGLPIPFARAPRLTVYRRELYDYAECLNLCLLLRDVEPRLESVLHSVIEDLFSRWSRLDGSFRSRQLLLGWDNVPMHRWGQAQVFRSLALLCVTLERVALRQPQLQAGAGV